MKVAICYWRLKSFDGSDFHVGGIETYLLNLAELCRELEMTPVLYQCAEREFRCSFRSLEIVGVKTPALTNTGRVRRTLYRRAIAEMNPDRDILLFGGDQWSVPTNYPRAIAIQHGIGWDCPIELMTKKRVLQSGPGEQIKRWSLRRRYLSFFRNCRNRVCVDYNFYNWYRTYATIGRNENIWIVPNATGLIERERLESKLQASNGQVRIAFVRRFESRRGSRLMGDISRLILRKHPTVRITFAGDGSDRQWLLEQFNGEPRVEITKWSQDSVLAKLYEHDVSVVPSLGSEGTTLSVVEAMGAGCAVVAAGIGGITNLILDDHNGILVKPEPAEVLAGIERVILDKKLRLRLTRNGYETAVNCFSAEKWRKKWKHVLNTVRPF